MYSDLFFLNESDILYVVAVESLRIAKYTYANATLHCITR